LDAAQKSVAHSVVISNQAPLLTDMSVAENIALPKQYHNNMRYGLSIGLAEEWLGRLGLQQLANVYPHALEHDQIFAVLWLRAVMLQKPYLLLDRPLSESAITREYIEDIAQRTFDLFSSAVAYDFSPHTEP
jgi:ABC-type nitrate/sulfonate/bicarbonate transport system ATPase subunit